MIKILVSGGDGRFASELKKIKSLHKFIFLLSHFFTKIYPTIISNKNGQSEIIHVKKDCKVLIFFLKLSPIY